MFNVAVIRLKDLIRYGLVLAGILAIIILTTNYFKRINISNINFGQKVSNSISKYAKKTIEIEIPEIKYIQEDANEEQQINENKENSNEIFKTKIMSMMLNLELGILNIKENTTEVANTEEIKEEKEKADSKNDDNDKNIEFAKDNVKTEVTTKNPIADSYTKKYKDVKIKNETTYDLTDEDLNFENLKIDKSNIIIFHTHTCESYTSSEKYNYTPTGNYRTTDLKYSVARVGDELTNYLKKYNINVVHDRTYHDYPSYTGSYSRSLKTVSGLLKKTKADIIIDLHRDAIGSNSKYAPTVKIGDDECAQLMFVIGSDGGGLKHPEWKKNLQFAIKMQDLSNKEYPGLFKTLILRNSRYNQQLGKAACIIEVGATGNTLEQCLNSMKYLSKIINEIS